MVELVQFHILTECHMNHTSIVVTTVILFFRFFFIADSKLLLSNLINGF